MRIQMMKAVLAMGFAVGLSPLRAEVGASSLYQSALIAETSERDLEKAVLLYQEAAKAAGDDAALIANAHLRMGVCYEKLGKPDLAREAYRKVSTLTSRASSETVLTAEDNLRRLE